MGTKLSFIHACATKTQKETTDVKKRQREVIKKIVEKVLSLNSLSHYKGIIESVSDNMQTNIALDSNSLLQLLGYKDALSTIHQYQLKGEDATLADGGSYQIVTSKHLLKFKISSAKL